MINPRVKEVVAALQKSKNVLLYGPPGTGKTWLVSQLVAYLNERQPAGGQPTLKLGETSDQFGTSAGTEEFDDLPQELEIEWVTFHQSYSYEEFIVGKRPKPSEGGIILEPHFGVLMSIAIKLSQGD
jgi:5-methylcytosine-specific restriction enzyme B